MKKFVQFIKENHKVGDKVEYYGRMHRVVRILDDGKFRISSPSKYERPVVVNADDIKPWQKKEPAYTNPRGTCQICGGNFGVKTGAMPHHGYRRPGSGWQTNSCEGAKHPPFEKSRDVLGKHIEGLKKSIEHHTDQVRFHSTDHGEKIGRTEIRYVGSHKMPKFVEYEPDHPRYLEVKKQMVNNHGKQAQLAAMSLEHQSKRHANWKPSDKE